MKSALLSIVSVTIFAAGAFSQSTLTVNTPLNVVACQPLQITWSGGTFPYFVSIHPGATPDGAALLDFGQQNGTSVTLSAVTFPSGTSLDITVRDSNGLISQTAPFTVQTGTSTACLNSTASISGGTAPSTSATTPATSSSTPSTTGTSPTTSKPAGSSSSSAPATTTSAKSGAMPIGVSYAVAGVLGAVAVALLA